LQITVQALVEGTDGQAAHTVTIDVIERALMLPRIPGSACSWARVRTF